MAQNGVIKEPLDLLETQLGINMVVKMVFSSNQLGVCLGLLLTKTVTININLLTTKILDVNKSVHIRKTIFNNIFNIIIGKIREIGLVKIFLII